jgi:hypothetical protein
VSASVPFGGLFPVFHISEASCVDYSHFLACSVEEEEGERPQRFHPRPRVTEGVQGDSRRAQWVSNKPSVRVFKVAAPERVGFAKHREAAERKAAALAAADAPTKKTGMKNIPASAATAVAEGRARKKRGGRPADSPPAAKRTQVVDVESGVVEDVIVAVPLRSAAPSV